MIDINDYRMTYDLHTHTIYSPGRSEAHPHASGTIMENVAAAAKAGLNGIAISDHGPGHIFYGLKLENIPKIRKEIAEAKEKYSELDIYLSVEANIVEGGNCLDVNEEDAKIFDFLICGYHYGVKNGRMINNWFDHKGIALNRKSLLVKNTDMTVKALYENNIKILTHPGDKYPVDLDAVSKACEENKTLMEINTRHKHLTAAELKTAMKYDVKFIISSDAHSPERVGDFREGVLRALEAGLDLTRIVNIERMR